MKPLNSASLGELQRLQDECVMKTKRYVPGYFVYSKYWGTIDLIIDCDNGIVTAMAITEPNRKCVSELVIRTHQTAFGSDHVLLSAFPYRIIKQLEAEGVDTAPIFDVIIKQPK